jgi:F-type H+-transporting ATPase subunit delta
MKITNSQYAKTLFDLVKDSSEKDRLVATKSFAKLLISRHDAYRLDKIISEFENIWNKEFNIVKAETSSFSPLNAATTKLLSEYIKKSSAAQEVVMDFKIDKSILGGVVIKYGDRIFDAGLKSRLNKLKERIIN